MLRGGEDALRSVVKVPFKSIMKRGVGKNCPKKRYVIFERPQAGEDVTAKCDNYHQSLHTYFDGKTVYFDSTLF